MFFYDKYDIIIVGGGISGLFLAYKLMNTKLNILLIEKEKEFGGRIHTIYKIDYHYECAAARFSDKHNKLITLINELDLKDDIMELPSEIDIIIHNKKVNINTGELLKESVIKSKKFKKEYLENILFFQYLIEIYGFEKADMIRNAYGYDSEFLKLNADAAIKMFKKDILSDSSKYYTLKNGLSSIIKNIVELLEYSTNVTLKNEEGLSEITDDLIKTDKDFKYNYEKLILTIPKESLKKIEYLKDIKEIDTVNNVPLLRIYMKYPDGKDKKPWFKNIKRTTTNNYLRQIIPIDYKNGLIMISYTDGLSCDMLSSLYNTSKDKLVESVHREIKELFGISPPEPDEVLFHYWSEGCHFWNTGEDMNKIYDKILKPMNDKELYICNESFCKKQAWIEGSLGMAYDILKKLHFENIKIKVKKEKKIKNYKIDDVLKQDKWIILEIDDELRIYDLSKWIKNHPGGDKIYNGIEANMYYKNKKEAPESPIELFMGVGMHSDKNVIKKFLVKKNKYVKHIGFLI